MSITLDYYIKNARQNAERVYAFQQNNKTILQNFKQFLIRSLDQASVKICEASQSVTTNEKKISKLKEAIASKNEQILNQNKWHQLTKTANNFQNQLQELAKADYEEMKVTNLAIEDVGRKLLDTLTEKQQRLIKAEEFMKSLQASNLSIHTKQPYQRRIFTPKSSKYKNQVGVEFNPEARELIFRVQTFEGKIVEFIVFFDQIEKKFGLKNPWKNFLNMDFMVVRSLNVHQDICRAFEEFQLLVVQYIDNTDDLPKFAP